MTVNKYCILNDMKKSNSIYSYLDYRLFLRDWYNRQISSKAPLSYRAIASAVGYNSPAYITMIFKGKANLSKQHTFNFSQLLKLNKRESEFFELLVEFNQEKKKDHKKNLLEKIIKFNKNNTTLLTSDQFEYYQKWYYSVIHDILSFYRFDGNYSRLAAMVEPSITAREAQKAVRLLEKLKFIQKRPDGGYDCHYKSISAYSEGTSLVLSSYAEKMIDSSKHALNELPDNERVISWVGFSASEEMFQKIKEEARTFRKRIVEMVQSDPNPNRAFHLNLQIFPVSKTETPLKNEKQ